MPDGWGGRVRRIREEEGLSRKELAGIAEVSASTIARLERGLTTPSLVTREKLIAAINKVSAKTFKMEDIFPIER